MIKKIFMAFLMMYASSGVVMAQSAEQEKEVKYKKSYFELSYSATSFDEAKASGCYGISWTMLPWKLAGGLYLGFNLSPFNFNFGLVDSDYTTDVIKFGPALGFHFSKGFMVAVPVDVTCAVGFGDETSTAWGMQIALPFISENQVVCIWDHSLVSGLQKAPQPAQVSGSDCFSSQGYQQH